MCPSELYKTLNALPNVASGKITFEEMEGLIMNHVHQKWNDKKADLHSCEASGPPAALGNSGETFELDGEVYRLENQGGRRVPVKQPKKPNEFKTKSFSGKCFRCDRTGHRSKDCTFKAKKDGSPLNPRKDPNKILNTNNVEEVEEEAECGSIELFAVDIAENLHPLLHPLPTHGCALTHGLADLTIPHQNFMLLRFGYHNQCISKLLMMLLGRRDHF